MQLRNKILGLMYADGLGVAQDFKQARFWFEKAAAQGNVKAKAVLQQLNQMGNKLNSFSGCLKLLKRAKIAFFKYKENSS